MKGRCCRSTPRCAGCPVLARRAQVDGSRRAQEQRVVDDVLGGLGRRIYPPGVVAALRELESARAGRSLAVPVG